MLCLLVDLAALDGDAAGRAGADPARRSSARYRPELLERPRLVVGTKADIAQPTDELGSSPTAGTRSVISAVTREGSRRARRGDGGARPRGREQPSRCRTASCCCGRCRRAPPSSASATHEFRLVGRDVERVVALNDITTPEAIGLHRPPARAPRRRTGCCPRRRGRRRRRVDRRLQLRVPGRDASCASSPRSGRRR